MNDPMAARSYSRHAQTAGTSGKPRLQSSEFEWEPQKRSFRETLLFWRNFGYRLYSTLTKPRLPPGYYAVIENLNLKRGEAIFLIVMVFVSGRMSFNVTTNLMNNMPEVDLIAHAQASETIQSNTYRKTEKLGYFLEDCY